MDPDAALAELLDAFLNVSHEAALEALRNLTTWVDMGGALPKDPRVATLNVNLSDRQLRIVSSALLAALDSLHPHDNRQHYEMTREIVATGLIVSQAIRK